MIIPSLGSVVFHISQLGKIEMSLEGSDVCLHKDDDEFWKRADVLSKVMITDHFAKINKLQLEVVNEAT